MSTRKCAERAAIDLVVAKAFDLLVLHSSAKTNLKLKKLMDENGGYGVQQLIRELDREVQSRVMDPEVLTHNLLEVYVALSQASRLFKEINTVCNKLSVFIKNRSDLVGTFISVLSREEQHVISHSNSDHHLKTFSDEYVVIEDDNDEDNWFRWMPHPRLDNIHQELCVSSNLISALFSIFGSKEKFLEQYQKELASRLVLHGWSKSVHFEVVGILRKIFSDRETESCEVMLWDIRNSEKLLPFAIRPKILSSEYWPDSFISGSEKVVNFHAFRRSIDPVLKEVGMYFGRNSLLRRHLNWSSLENSHNIIEIELEVCELVPAAKYEVSLIDAIIITLFLEKEQWAFDELNSAVGLETPIIRDSVHRWYAKKLLSRGISQTVYEKSLYLLMLPRKKRHSESIGFSANGYLSEKFRAMTFSEEPTRLKDCGWIWWISSEDLQKRGLFTTPFWPYLEKKGTVQECGRTLTLFKRRPTL